MAESPTSFGIVHQFDFQQHHNPSIYINFKALILRTITICLGSFYVGFTLVYYYSMTSWYCIALNDFQSCHSKSYFLVGAIIPLAAIVSSLFICPIFERLFSRRYILIIGSLLGIVGGVLIIICYSLTQNLFSTNFRPLFLIGRVLHGFSVGLYMTFCLVTINQFSPAQLKMGMIGTYQISIQLGIIATNTIFLFLAKYLFSYNTESWRVINNIMFGLSMVALILQFFLLLFVFKEDTPTYLLSKQKYQEAREVVSSIYHKEYVNEKFLELKAEVNLDSTELIQDVNPKSLFWKGLFLGAYAIVTQQMSGINFINTFGIRANQDPIYSNLYIFKRILPEICQLSGTILLLVVNNFDALRNVLGKSKRKILMHVGTISCCIIMFVTLVLESIQNKQPVDNPIVWMVLQSAFMFVYGFTLGPVCCLYISEMLSCFQVQLAIALHWVLSFLNMYGLAIVESDKSTRWVGPLILFLVCLTLSILHKWYLIQTKNQSKLEIVRKIDAFRVCFCKKQT